MSYSPVAHAMAHKSPSNIETSQAMLASLQLARSAVPAVYSKTATTLRTVLPQLSGSGFCTSSPSFLYAQVGRVFYDV